MYFGGSAGRRRTGPQQSDFEIRIITMGPFTSPADKPAKPPISGTGTSQDGRAGFTAEFWRAMPALPVTARYNMMRSLRTRRTAR